MLLRKHFKLYWVQAIQSFLGAGFLLVLNFYFFSKDIFLGELFLAEALASIIVAAYIMFRRVVYSRFDIQFGIFLIGVAVLLLFLPFSISIFYIYTILRTAGHIIFYIPYNIAYFKSGDKNHSLRGMARYFAIIEIGAVAGPLVGIYLLNISLVAFVVFALFMAFLSLVLATYIPKHEFKYSTKEVLTHIRNFRTIHFVDGALQKSMAVISLFALFFINTGLGYAAFLSFSASLSIMASIYLAHISDRGQKRTVFIAPLSIACGIIASLFFFVRDLVTFIMLIVSLNILMVLVDPIRANIIQDSHNADPVNWISRELFVNLGRGALFFAAFLSIHFDIPGGIFIILGVLHASFPFLLKYKEVRSGGKSVSMG